MRKEELIERINAKNDIENYPIFKGLDDIFTVEQTHEHETLREVLDDLKLKIKKLEVVSN